MTEEPADAKAKRLEERIEQLEREAEETRRRHEARQQYWRQLEGIIDCSPLAIYLKDAAHTYLLVNREYERLSAQPRASILGRTDFDLFPEPVAQLFRDQDLEATTREEPTAFKETIPLPDGVHTFITSKFPVRSESGEFGGIAGVCTDITELEHARQRLEQAQGELVKRERLAALGELTAVVAHEVRNPLAVIFNVLASLERALASDDRSRELLGILTVEADRLNRMVGSLLELAHPAHATPQATEVGPLVEEAIAAARTLVDPAAEVLVERPAPLPAFVLDRELVRQALVNLVCNALQAPGRQGPVRVRVAMEPAPESALRLEVIDDGAGVPPELAERIFAPFFTTRATGSGLGLAVVQRVAEAHGGTVSLSPTPDGGATFALRLPARSGGEAAA